MASPLISRIGQVSVPVSDLDKAVSFYGTTLGLPLLSRAAGLATFDCGGVRLMLAVPQQRRLVRPTSIVYYEVADIHVAQEALQARGVVFEVGPHVCPGEGAGEIWQAFFRDPDRNILALLSFRPGAAASAPPTGASA